MSKPRVEAGDTVAPALAPRSNRLQPNKLVRFEKAVLPHLNAAYNLARWLLRNHDDAEDAVQESYLRAFRFFDSFDGLDARPWLLSIVRNRCLTILQQNAKREAATQLDNEIRAVHDMGSDPESDALRKAEIDALRSCIETLPLLYREVIVLRDLEEMSYREIAGAAGVPVGTVMSRLSRARLKLQACLVSTLKGGRG